MLVFILFLLSGACVGFLVGVRLERLWRTGGFAHIVRRLRAMMDSVREATL